MSKKQFPFVHPTTVLGPFVHPSSKGTVNREEEGQKQQQKRRPQEDALLGPEGGDGPRSIILSLGAKEEEEEEETAWQLKEGAPTDAYTHSTTDAPAWAEGVFLFLSVPCVEEVPFFLSLSRVCVVAE